MPISKAMLRCVLVCLGLHLLAIHARRDEPSVAAEMAIDMDVVESSQMQLEHGDDVKAALQVSEILWEHMEAKDCLQNQTSLRKNQEPSQDSLVDRVWDLELKHDVLAGLHTSLWSYVANELRVKTGMDKEAILQKEIVAAEKHELIKLKQILETEYEFSYDLKKQACVQDAQPRLEAAKEQVQNELEKPCGGTCSKLSSVGVSECQETTGPAATPCPEGTSCGCNYQTQKGLAAAVGAVSYILSWGALAYFVPGGAFMPGPLELSTLISFLVASKADGCRCSVSPCIWDSARMTCAPKPAKKTRNPFQSALPYIGQVCAKKPGAFHLSMNPACDLLPCWPEVYNYVGQVGNETFNCQAGHKSKTSHAMFPPLSDRMKTYMKLFPDELGDYMRRMAN